MTDSDQKPDAPELPEAVVKSRSRMQLIWLVPIVAVLIGGWLAVKAILEQGPTITISFQTGEGLEAGKTKIKFKDVDIGVVKSVTLSHDRKRVVATADISKDATNLLVENTRFWVVRPRVSGGTISGLSTLLSGSYVGVDAKNDGGKSRRDFIGLEMPPVFASDVPGREFVLKSEDLGSLDVGSPVYFHRLEVGQVAAYALDPDGKGITLRVFVNAPYDKFVRADTRFWHASGIDLALDTNGLRLNTQSLVSIAVGGIAFQAADDSMEQQEASGNTQFALYANRSDAMRQRDRIVDKYAASFTESVRGLTVGAPVEFRGIVIGEVTGIYTRFDPTTNRISIPVEFNVYPERFTTRYQKAPSTGRITHDPRKTLEMLVEHGFRIQLRTGNLLTGQLYLAIDFFPNAPKAKVSWNETPPEVPTVPGTLQSLQESATRLIAKLNAIPVDAISNDTRQTLQSANALLARLDGQVAPQAKDTLVAAHEALNSANRMLQPDSSLQQNTADTMRELARTAAAIRLLADYLERHPEALIRGKPEGP